MGALTPSIPNPPAPPPRPKNWFQRHWVLAIVGSCFVLMLLFAGFLATIFAVVETSFKKSDSYVQALAKARSNPPVMEKFGQPLEPGWFGSGNIQVTGPSGSADLKFQLPDQSERQNLRGRQKVSRKLALRNLGSGSRSGAGADQPAAAASRN